MTSRWSNPMEDNRLTDLEGTDLPGGTLEFYEADTSTPLAVYSDPELTVSLGSVLTADAFALIEDFHLAAGTAYKTIAKDSGGATKWTRDDVWSLDSSTDTRLDALESSVQNISVIRNSFTNSGCGKQKVDSNSNVITAPTISSTFQVGTVAGHYARATNSSAGTIERGTTTAVTSGYYLALTGVTTTDAAAVAEARFVVPAGDAGRFQGSDGTFTCLVYHDTGTAKDYTVTAKKMDSEDDLSSLTTISTSSATSVTSGSWTTLTFSVSAFGDCRNGLVFDVSCACGVQTTKAYWFTMPMLDSGLIARTWTSSPALNDFAGLEFESRQYPTDYISEDMDVSVDTDTEHDVQITASACRDATDSFDIDLAAVITKQLDAAWAEGDDAGGLPSGVTLSGPEWVYVFLIAKTDGTVDAGFDTSTTATNLLADATAYTYYRLVGAGLTDSSNNFLFAFGLNDRGTAEKGFRATSSITIPEPDQTVLPFWEKAIIQGAGGGGCNDSTNGTAGGSTTLDTDFVAGGGSGAQAISTSGAGGVPFPSGLQDLDLTKHVTDRASGQDGETSSSARGGESGSVAQDGITSYPTFTGGAINTNDANNGGGGGGRLGTNAGGGGGAYIQLAKLATSGGNTLSVGAKGSGGAAGSGDGGDGYGEFYV